MGDQTRKQLIPQSRSDRLATSSMCVTICSRNESITRSSSQISFGILQKPRGLAPAGLVENWHSEAAWSPGSHAA
jgi:hypothetical protein